ncbi:hypothetical protein LOK74_15175 [Brevibacillus humidisoli]|uniref:hypothetical protein n=1 Tax=Brevibacillus humidisoli TaxID=2895522 RepID=UPI001E4442DC|nr:hypothetical protein [Brevibacillus humidisoli]UFJ39407.1 hypothetical protein LOK74_15175 [Brevibacillus humidisoli]
MNKQIVQAIISDLRELHGLPEEVQTKILRLHSILASYSDEQFESASDGVVTRPAAEQMVTPDDPGRAVYDLYAELDQYAEQNRSDGIDSQVVSLLQRLRGLLDAYERDFP